MKLKLQHNDIASKAAISNAMSYLHVGFDASHMHGVSGVTITFAREKYFHWQCNSYEALIILTQLILPNPSNASRRILLSFTTCTHNRHVLTVLQCTE